MALEISPDALMALSKLSNIGESIFSKLNESAQKYYDKASSDVVEAIKWDRESILSDIERVSSGCFENVNLGVETKEFVLAGTQKELTEYLVATHKEVYSHLIAGNHNQYEVSVKGMNEALSLMVATAMEPLWLFRVGHCSDDYSLFRVRMRYKVNTKVGALIPALSWPVKDSSYVGDDIIYEMRWNLERSLDIHVDRTESSMSDAEGSRGSRQESQDKLNIRCAGQQAVPKEIRQYAALLSSACMYADIIGQPFAAEEVMPHLIELEAVIEKMNAIMNSKYK